MLCAPDVQDLARRDLAVRRKVIPGFSRPGLLTMPPQRERPSPFARVWGHELRQLVTVADLQSWRDAACLHIIDRVTGAAITDERAKQCQDVVGLPVRDSRPGETVIDVIYATGEPTWAGLHTHDQWAVPDPGGSRAADVPADAPSRAYAKIEEAIAWRDLAVKSGHVALEVGAAPGGAALALARRGLQVIGIDTGAIAPHVLGSHPGGGRVTHLAKKLGAVQRTELPDVVHWLLIDVNLAPGVALHEAQRLIPPLRAHLRGVIFTWKLNDATFIDELPRWERSFAEWAIGPVALRHLPSNRRELCAISAR